MTSNMKRARSVLITAVLCFLMCIAFSKCSAELPYARTDDNVKTLSLAIGTFEVKAEYAPGTQQVRIYMVQMDGKFDPWFADNLNIKSYSPEGLQPLTNFRQVRVARGSMVLDVFIHSRTTSVVLLHNARPMLLVKVVR